MAGSYNHTVDKTTGKLLRPKDLRCMVENGGDFYETIEEMYGMIWSLATWLEAASGGTRKAAESVEYARRNYQAGLKASPGTDGELGDNE